MRTSARASRARSREREAGDLRSRAMEDLWAARRSAAGGAGREAGPVGGGRSMRRVKAPKEVRRREANGADAALQLRGLVDEREALLAHLVQGLRAPRRGGL